MIRTNPNTRAWFALVVGLAISAATGIAWAADAPLIVDAPRPERVLFIGNSFTYYNNSLHAHVRNLAADLEPDDAKKRTFRAMTISGGRLDEHVLGSRGLISAGVEEPKRAWDIVVLQGHSRAALTEATAATFANSAATLDGWVREAGARSVLFMTWAYSDRPEMTQVVDGVYTRVGNRLATLVAPVGLAFARARGERPDLILHTEDTIHPTLLGTYLAANVFYATLYGRTPEAAKYTAGLDAEDAAFARRIAWQVVRDYQAR